MSSEMTRSIPAQAGGFVTSRRRRLQKTYAASPPWASAIPEEVNERVSMGDEGIAEEDEDAPCCSRFFNFSDFDFMAGEVIPGVPRNDNEVNKVDHAMRFGEYLIANRP